MKQFLFPLLLIPAPLLAQEAPRQFALPAGCTGYLTVQAASCTLSHHFTCEGDPEGWQRRVDLDEGGVSYFGAIDAETQWVESFHVLAGRSETLGPDPVDRASFSGLLATGVDTYDFTTVGDDGLVTRFVGQDRLTGRTFNIDGVVLDETDFAIRAIAPDGTEMWRSSGNEYISRDYTMFLSGRSVIVTPEDSWETNDSPVDFVYPGEPGFLTGTPIHGCDTVLSKTVP